MLILPKEDQLRQVREERKGLESHYNSELEKIINANTHKDVYWILGKVRFPEEYGGKVGRTFLEACDDKPPLVKNAFLYEVDNRKGVKTILWISHPDGTLRLPTLNKTIRIAPERARKQQGLIV